MLTTLPVPDHLQLAARYVPATVRNQVGGDWYDAVILADGALAVTIGDVTGHDLEAATRMGELRNLLRGLAVDRREGPAALLHRLEGVAARLALPTVATMFLAIVEPADDVYTISWTNAGHPPPVLITPGGEVRLLDSTPDLLIGIDPSTVRNDFSTSVSAGSTMLLYTDGLIERRGQSLRHGIDTLMSSCREHQGLQPTDLLNAVLEQLLDGEPADDVAVLVLRT